jgi:pilus assembly protein CpaE
LLVHTGRVAFGEGTKSIARYEPHVVVVADTIDDAAIVVETLDNAAPDVPLLAILPEGDIRAVQDCTMAGARATLLKPFDRAGLVKSIQLVYDKETRRKKHLTAALDAGTARPQRPRIIAIHGAKGGVGTTTLAVNFAAALQRLTGRRVGFVDADLLSGDAGVLFDLSWGRSISDLVPELRDLDADLVNSVMPEHSSGVRVLLAPLLLQRAEAIRADDVQRTLAGLKPYFDYLIVDTPSRFGPVTLATLDEADVIVLVITPELTALRSAARFLQLGGQLGYGPDRVMLVANRANSGKGITTATIEEQLQRRITVSLPSDGNALVENLNVGDLIVAARPRNKVSEGITQLAREVAANVGWDVRKEQRRPALPPPAAAADHPENGTGDSSGNGAAPPPGDSGGSGGAGADGAAGEAPEAAAPRRGWFSRGRWLFRPPQTLTEQSE